jgi:hypothetical protein
MGYANPIEAMGIEKFAARARRRASTACSWSTIRPRNASEFAALLKRKRHRSDLPAGADLDRQAHRAGRARIARGYLYYVSLKGVTGAGNIDTRGRRALPRSAPHVKLPIGVGFGIRDADGARVAQVADAVVIGSRIIQEIERGGPREAAAARRVKPAFPAPTHPRGARRLRSPHELAAEAAAAEDPSTGRRARRRARGPVDQVPVVRGGALQHRPREEPQRLPEVRPPPRIGARAAARRAARPEGRFEIGSEVLPVDTLKFKDSRRYTSGWRKRSEQTGETDALVVMQGSIKSAAAGVRGVRVRLHGRLDGLGGRRALRARRARGDRAEAAVRLRHRHRRRAHAGRRCCR